MNKQANLYLITINGYFGQSIPTEKSLDVGRLSYLLAEHGFSVKSIELEDLANSHTDRAGVFIFGSHQNPDIKNYIDDVVAALFMRGTAKCLPRAELILAHENKGIQAILGRKLNLELPEQRYLINRRPPSNKLVIKHVEGSGSSKVFLCEANQDYFKSLLLSGLGQLSFSNTALYIKAIARKIIKSSNFTPAFFNYKKKYFRHIQQEYLSSPGFDYKVLVFFDKCYVLKRRQRKADFRSSGSGLFEFVTPSRDLLQTALEMRAAIDTPYVSLDILQTSNGYKCIEFQCVHFGPYTQIHANNFYQLKGGRVIAEKNNWTLEEAYVYGMAQYLAA